jgi:hypothetical protein
MKKMLLLATMLAMLLAGAALAETCRTYCGEFAGFKWCTTTCR